MKILVVGAMNEEIAFLKTKLNNLKEEEHSKFLFFTGTINNNDIILVESGIGRCMSGALIATAKAFYDFDCVINVGIAGGAPSTNLGDIIVGKTYVYGDVDLTGGNFGYTFGQMAGCPKYFKTSFNIDKYLKRLDYKLGDICTCDSFTTSLDQVKHLQNDCFSDLNLLCFDMESAAFAQICLYYNIPFLAIRSISDVIGKEFQDQEYKDNEFISANKVNEFMFNVLNNIK